jgi:hypothetical protein
MNKKIKVVVAIAFTTVWFMRPGATFAQGFSVKHICLSANVFEEGATKTNDGISVTKPLLRSVMTANSLLKQLAADEYASTNWSSNSFPNGAKLNFDAASGFSVVDKSGKELVNVGNIVSWQAQGAVSLLSGNADSDAQTHQLMRFVYDTSAIGGICSFNVTALASLTARMTKPDASGNYLESDSLLLQNGLGEGTNAQGRRMIITGFILTASGRQSLNTNNVPQGAPGAPLDQAVYLLLPSFPGGPPAPPPLSGPPPPPD